ncbi:NAD(P)-dependent alcohol dehydrogenase [Cohnella sp. CIP 111063]|uniref:NAD(P)-dependent alcohol dehydrogenase n=1 Tax=unclassified Cohnella TaxID=2636738 RepID=UPI000B8BDACF|nr:MULTISPECIES: NAD(P)-dependent alcohol dehydrogenase [unclassified Cohnella]OXS52924.1 NAD(P)-dependent alcohol dehydrogenase [Cohnella sp. CIP 111063]PRX60177.1 NADPH:quinone reductase-like Zn-dependent oxidoreductase [Cohnella sp. SGD-V74]
MKAVVCTKYGPPEVLQLREVAKPSPKRNEVCIKIHATAVTASDVYIRGSQLPLRFWLPMRLFLGFARPRKSVIGMVLAGEVESVGNDVKRFKAGDQVYGVTGFGLGAYAQYTCMKETDSMYGCLSLKPENISCEEATAAAYGGLLALQRIEESPIECGQRILVYGASGTSGTMAVQLAKYYGAEVTAVCGTRNLEFVQSLGADRVIDYTRDDTAHLADRYDMMFDMAGKAKSSKVKERCKQSLRPAGRYISIDDGKLELNSARLARIKALIEAGAVRPVVDAIYPLERIVEAHAYVETGRKRGGVAVSVPHSDSPPDFT